MAEDHIDDAVFQISPHYYYYLFLQGEGWGNRGRRVTGGGTGVICIQLILSVEFYIYESILLRWEESTVLID